jgi:hypothetical protein
LDQEYEAAKKKEKMRMLNKGECCSEESNYEIGNSDGEAID